MESLWYSIRRVVYGGTEGDGVVKVALESLQAVGRALGSEVNKVSMWCVCVHVCVCACMCVCVCVCVMNILSSLA